MNIKLVVFVLFLSILLSACIASDVPPVCLAFQGTSDYEMCLRDKEAYEFMVEAEIKAEEYSAMATQQAASSPVPTYVYPAPTQSFSTSEIWCGVAEPGDNLGLVAQKAYGAFPPVTLNGIAMLVGIFHEDEEPQIFILEDLFNKSSINFQESPVINVGDEICVSLSREVLNQH